MQVVGERARLMQALDRGDIGHWTLDRGDTEVRRHSPAHNAGSEHRPQVQDEVSTCGLVEALGKAI